MKKILLTLTILLSSSISIAQNLSLQKSTAITTTVSTNGIEDGWHGGCLFIDGVRQYCIRH